MNNNETKEFCLSLLEADSEEGLVDILKSKGYWDDPSIWRLYGDKEGNYSTAGGQQSSPDGSLVEKIINSVDASLTSKCLMKKINPESKDAPNSIREAVTRFYENNNKKSGGLLLNWGNPKRREEAKNITLATTGTRKFTCITVADSGEGQTPSRFSDTILSIEAKNKQRIRFVQGKFNMGGTGVLRHCRNGLQLVISKRKPKIVDVWEENKNDKTYDEWGFTIVRRERPTGKVGDVIHSEFRYLAPLDNGKNAGVLRFKSKSIPAMPRYNDAYIREIAFGTVIKLYGYDLSAGSSNILRKNGLIYRLEALLPAIALPIRLHECRKQFGGTKEKSFETNLNGLSVRLEDGKGDNLDVEPWDVPFCVNEIKFKAKIYVFKNKKSETYLNNEGIIFSINGQAHGHIPKSIFGRKKVGLSRIGKDMLVLVDCSEIPVDAREDLFMTSRDRLSKGELRITIEKQLEEILANDPKLRSLQESRRLEDQEEKLSDEKPLADVLNDIIKASPSLSTLFLKGQRLNMPKTSQSSSDEKNAGDDEGNESGGSDTGDKPFIGKKHPTIFQFEKKPKSDVYERKCEQGRIVRVIFITDVENGYFTRSDNPGSYNLKINDEELNISHSCTLHDGIVVWSISLPENLIVGTELELKCEINDDVILEPFIRTLKLTVISKKQKTSGGSKKRKRHGKGKGSKPSNSDKGLSMPHITKVKDGDKYWNKYDFDHNTACHVIGDPINGEKDKYIYQFYINMDNIHLQNEMKNSKHVALQQAKYLYGNVLIGLSLIYGAENNKNPKDDGEDSNNVFKLQEDIKRVTGSFSPFLIPMINSLGNLTDDEVSFLSTIGDDE